MINRSKAYKGKQLKRLHDVPALIKAVKMLELKSVCDLVTAHQLLAQLFTQWSKLNEKFRIKVDKTNSINKNAYANYEAEGQIIIGLAVYLNERMMGLNVAMRKL